MNWDRIEGNWKQLRRKVQQHWSKLTDDDLTTSEGRREAGKQVDSWFRKSAAPLSCVRGGATDHKVLRFSH